MTNESIEDHRSHNLKPVIDAGEEEYEDCCKVICTDCDNVEVGA